MARSPSGSGPPPVQVLALKAFCHRYADFLQDHLDRYQSEEDLHRSRRRFDQASRVIDEINAALGLIPEHGRALERGRRDAITLAERLDSAINSLRIRGEGLENQAILPLLDLRESVRRCLTLCGRPPPRLPRPIGSRAMPLHGTRPRTGRLYRPEARPGRIGAGPEAADLNPRGVIFPRE